MRQEHDLPLTCTSLLGYHSKGLLRQGVEDLGDVTFNKHAHPVAWP